MPSFGSRSEAALATCHPLIIKTAKLAIRHWDFGVHFGWRDEETQNDLVRRGLSKTPWPQSRHNHLSDEQDVEEGYAEEVGQPLSLAFDWAPWFPSIPHIRWNRPEEFYHMAGLIIGVSQELLNEGGFRWRYGGDWDNDQDLRDQTFMDLGHLELRRT
jgi:peptidoglycan L-alanyl-D-glutamate endopeptidase CwlK